MASGKGVDLSGGSAGNLDLSGGASSVSAPAPAPAPAGGYDQTTGQIGASMAAAALQNKHVQQHIQDHAGEAIQQGLVAAREGATTVAGELHHYVQEGPAGISVLCFLGGLATTLIGILGLLNIGNGIQQPFTYLFNAYLTGFGFISVLLEADVEILATKKIVGHLAPVVERYQHEIFDRAKFLTELRGRGLFYLFVGTLAITQCWVCLLFICGLWNSLMGVLCLLMSFGINPNSFIPEKRPPAMQPGASPYGPVGGQPGP